MSPRSTSASPPTPPNPQAPDRAAQPRHRHSDAASRPSYLSLDGLRAMLILLFAVAQIAAGYAPQAFGWGETISSRSEAAWTVMTPAGYAFSIWALIFLWTVVYAIWQALPQQLDNPLLRRIGWYACVALAANTAWSLYAPAYGLDWGSVAIIWVGLAGAVGALLIARCGDIPGRPSPLGPAEKRTEAASPGRPASTTPADQPAAATVATTVSVAREPRITRHEASLAVTPLAILAGWVSGAAFANLAAALVVTDAAWPDPRGASAVALVVAATVLGSAVGWMSGSLAYAAALAWAFIAIAVENTWSEEGLALMAIASGSAAVVVLAATATGWLGRRRRKERR